MSLVDLTGRKFGRLTVTARADNRLLTSGRKFTAWTCVCECGTTLVVVGQNLKRGGSKSCGCLNRELMALVGRGNRKPGKISYSAAHRRVRAQRGRAPTLACVDCGAEAREWSYDHSDPNEWYEQDRRGRWIAYSGDPEHYSPRCNRCHQQYDKGRLDAGQ